MDIENFKKWSEYPPVNLKSALKPENLAYIIYTSGTTGTPKGVIVEHQNTCRLIADMDYSIIDESDNILGLSNFIFDASIYDIWGSLLNGATLVLSHKEDFLDFDKMDMLFKEYRITNLFMTTALFNSMVDANLNNISFLKCVLFGGEKTSVSHVAKFKERYKSTKLVNMYGPTECTTYATSFDIDKLDGTDIISVPIGVHINNTTVYVLDKYLHPLPVGAIGELYIGGDGVARGYLNQPELTAERFLVNPFQTEEEKQQGVNGRIYKTGDLVRYLPDGNIEYIGRNDFQVKIRGFRIELGEIESRLMGYPGIDNVAVLARENQKGMKYLVAYYVSSTPVEEQQLSSFIGEQLPEYMVPSFFVHMEQLPVTINGKLDRRALPEPNITHTETYIAPTNQTERILCDIFASVLGLDASELSTEDDFFRMGGDSISSIQLVNRIRQSLSVQISVKDIFAAKTVKTLSSIVEKQKGNVTSIVCEQGQLSGEVGLSPIQSWFFDIKDKGLLPAYNHWNQSFLISVPELDTDILKVSVNKLLEHHDSLRMSYVKEEDGSYRQLYNSAIPGFTIRSLDISQYEGEEQIGQVLSKWQSDFHLFNGKVFTVGYLSGYSEGGAKLFFAFHHLIIDTVSWRIIKDDLEKLYSYFINNPLDGSIPSDKILGNKSTSYRQWTDRITNTYPQEYGAEKSYWQDTIRDVTASNRLLEKIRRQEHVSTSIAFDEPQTHSLLRDINGIYNTSINDILLTALSSSLIGLTDRTDNYVLLEGHGREDLWDDVDISNTAGWFTSMYPVKLDASAKDLSQRIISTKEMLRQVPRNGIGYGALSGYTGNELPRISFNYLGQFNTSEQGLWSITTNGHVHDVSLLNKDTNIININGGVFDNKLSFSFIGYVSQEQIDVLAIRFKDALMEIIGYLSGCTRSYLTPSDIGGIISPGYLDRLQSDRQISSVYLANSLQQGFIYHAINQGEVDDAYRVQLSWEYNNPLDIDLIKKAWQSAQQKYETMRLRFAWEDELVQIIDKEGTLDWNYTEALDLDKNGRDEYLANLITEDRKRGFDLQSGILFRVYLIKFSEDHYGFLFSNHHAILDGWSMPVLLNYIHETYINLCKGQSADIVPDTSYGSCQRYLQEHRFANMDYWKGQVQMVETHEDLDSLLKPELRSQVILSDYKHILAPKEESIVIDGENLHKIKSLCSQHGFTVNALLQYCWHRQLSVYGATETTVVGTVVSGRNLPVDGIEQSVGLYINTLPVILEHKDQPVIELIRSVQDKINEVNSRSDVSLASLQKEGKRLFNTLFVYENYPVPENNEINEVLKYEFKDSVEKLDYPLGVTIVEQGNQMHIAIKYASELFSLDTVHQLLTGIELLISGISINPDTLSCNISLLDKDTYQKTVYDWNTNQMFYPKDNNIIQMFEEQVEKTPNGISVTFEDTSLTYKQLNEKVNQLSRYLIDVHNVKSSDIIGICLDRSQYLVITMLAILKSGATYVPISAEYPKKRIKYILDDAKPSVIICNSIHTDKIRECNKNISTVSIEEHQDWVNMPIDNIGIPIDPAGTAYVIYTSGTTGNPKGVMVDHGNLLALIIFQQNDFKRKKIKKRNSLWYANYVFDAHVWELYYCLVDGYRLYILPHNIRLDINLLKEYIKSNSISIGTIPPAILDRKTLLDLDVLIVAGEVTDSQIMELYDKKGVQVLNAYGPTETTVCATIRHYKGGDRNTNIGRPIANTTVYVLDKYLHPLPVGAIGELYIGGDGVARGYLNQPELTAERFLVNPFQTEEEKQQGVNGRIYKTGDLVRYLPDGNIEYIGRNDFQVKIRGFRIELGEIESRLMGYPGIDNVAVLARENQKGVKYIVAYYVSSTPVEEQQLSSFIGEQLPEYMVPSFFVHMEQLPVTINGKLDRRALPEPNITHTETYIAPTNETERILCDIFASVLGLDASELSTEDDFFRMGGDSILSVKLMNRINKQFNKSVSIGDIFSHSSVSSLASIIKKDKEFSLLVPLSNYSENKKDIYMIHPGGAGCEVYRSVANKLDQFYNCIGIDSYNLYNEMKITNIKKLAEKYVEYIEKVHNNDHEYNLFGWSLGGQIALKMAAILEKKGVENINIFSLDTILWGNDDLLQKIRDEEVLFVDQYLHDLESEKRFEGEIFELYESDKLLAYQAMESKLEKTNVVLFKATSFDEFMPELLKSYIIDLKYNNIDSVIKKSSKIKAINLPCHHYNILEDDHVINYLLNYEESL